MTIPVIEDADTTVTAEALVFMGNNTHPDPEKDRRGCWKRGMIVVLKPGGHPWGAREDPALATPPRTFAVLRFQGIALRRLEKYLAEQMDDAGGVLLEPVRYRRRLWQIQHAELPLRARNIIATTGFLTIGPSGDYTWDQVRTYFMRLDTAVRETDDLTGALL